jgi:hypothetical protein
MRLNQVVSKIKLNKKDKEKGLVLPTELSEDLAYLCGVLAGDGNINIRKRKYKHDYVIKCVGNPLNEKPFYHEIIKKKFKSIFGIDIEPKLLDKNTTYGFCVWSKSLVTFLNKCIGLPIGPKNEKLNIPKILKKSKYYIISFIMGLADTDFCLTMKKNNYPVIVGVSKNKILMKEISLFLKDIGFRVSYENYKYYDRRINKTTTSSRIYLSGRNQLLSWMKIIGFRNPKHLQKFELWEMGNSGGWI